VPVFYVMMQRISELRKKKMEVPVETATTQEANHESPHELVHA
jgi:hypothetical protein